MPDQELHQMVKRPLKLFLSYAEADEQSVALLLTHLSQLKRDGLIDTWHKRRIRPGDDRATVVDAHIEGADIILVVVSSDFLASDYSHDIELKRSLARHADGSARVVPIIVRPTNWQPSALGRLQPLPKDGKPVSTWASSDEAWLDVVRGIQELVEDRQALPLEEKPGAASQKRRPEAAILTDTSPSPVTPPQTWYRPLAVAAAVAAAFVLGVGANAVFCVSQPSPTQFTAPLDAGPSAIPEPVKSVGDAPSPAETAKSTGADPQNLGPSCVPSQELATLQARVTKLQTTVSNLATDGPVTIASIRIAAFFPDAGGQRMISLLKSARPDDPFLNQFPFGKIEEVRFAASATNNAAELRDLDGSLCIKYIDPYGHLTAGSKRAKTNTDCTLEFELNSKQFSTAGQNIEVSRDQSNFSIAGMLARQTSTTFSLPGLWHIEIWSQGRMLNSTGFSIVNGEGQLLRPDPRDSLKPYIRRIQ